jgi:uncharacterized protein (DUF1800 family)
MDTARLEISRLFHRFGFGPKPGEFAQALKQGVDATRAQLLLLVPPAHDISVSAVPDPVLADLGNFPQTGTPARATFDLAMRAQRQMLTLWWLDRMALADNALTERMTWFWHGHWATSIGKVEYSLPMYLQNQTLRANALGDFGTQSRAMIMDGALQYWLDGGANTVTAPNENLAREFMELFTLGVDHYLQIDVQSVARGLTGYRVKRSNGEVTFIAKNHDSSTLNILGSPGTYNATQISDLVVARDDCTQFISDRLWFRFISSDIPRPSSNPISTTFVGRNILKSVRAVATSDAMSDPQYSLVKSPVEWFIGLCRALKLTPSKLTKPGQVINLLNTLGQVPFVPPNVGGWPAGQAWLTAASAQYRLQLAQDLLAHADISAIKAIPASSRVMAVGDLLGVASWSYRTERALHEVANNPTRLLLLAASSPEYIVSA